MARIQNLLYGWSCTEDSLTQYMVGAWWANEPPGGTAVRLHLIPPKSLLREDELVFDQNAAIKFVHDNVLKPLADVGAFTDIIFEKRRVTVSLVPTAWRIKFLEEPAGVLDLKPWKIEKVETMRNMARWRWNPLWSGVSSWVDPFRAPEDQVVMRALKKLKKSPGSFEKRSGLDQPKLDPKKVMEGLAWLDKALEKFPADVKLYLNVHPVQRFVNFEASAPDRSFAGPLAEPVNEELAEYFGFDIEDARRIPAVFWKAGITAAPRFERIELTDDH